MNQRTLTKKYKFKGKGLHTGRYCHMYVGPAPVDTGIRFHRTDLGESAFVDAVAENVSKTARSTTISSGEVSVSTIEHLLSALTGMGIDNAFVEIDGPEVPILDGSAKPYIDAIGQDGVAVQDAERKWVEIDKVIEYVDPKSGSYIRIEPSDKCEYTSTIDFKSKVLGVQTINWTPEMDYASQIAPCRTFCFLHEIIPMMMVGLVKGGDVENALVIVDRPVSRLTIRFMEKLLHQPYLGVTPKGYLSNIELHYDDECGRHKMLDLIGDLRLCGGFLKAKVTAYKPGHSVNTKIAQQINK